MPKTYELSVDETLSADELIRRFITALSAGVSTSTDDEATPIATAGSSKETTLSLDVVRERVAKARVADKTLDLVAVLEKFGAKKLSDVGPENYNELLAIVEKA
jgi:hypothetical protein